MRLEVLKTYKLYIGGQFPRTESGRFYPLADKKGKVIANVCLSSRKDFRNAVVAARSAQSSWNGRSAYNRSQILYRIAEMMEGRAAQFVSELVQTGTSPTAAKKEVEKAIDCLVHYAGWCDKYAQIYSTVNPVASSHFNFSVPEPMGVVSLVAGEEQGLLGAAHLIAPVIAGGNTCVLLASEKQPLSAITLAEALQTSDLPAGVVNILTGKESEILPHMAGHMDVDAVGYARGEQAMLKMLKEAAAGNFKRVIDCFSFPEWSPENILAFQEIKTTWHPIESSHGGGGGY